MNAVKILLVDPHQLSREGMKRLLESEGHQVVAEAASLSEARARIPMTRAPDLLVAAFDDESDLAGGIDRVAADFTDCKTILLGNSFSRLVLTKALAAGIRACLLRDISIEALTHSLRLVLLGQQIFPTTLGTMLASPEAGGGASLVLGELAPRPRSLSGREREILRYLLDGESNKSIARSLGISEATVKVHLKALLRKVNAQNRTQAAVWGLANGFAPDDGEHGGAAQAKRGRAAEQFAPAPAAPIAREWTELLADLPLHRRGPAAI